MIIWKSVLGAGSVGLPMSRVTLSMELDPSSWFWSTMGVTTAATTYSAVVVCRVLYQTLRVSSFL